MCLSFAKQSSLRVVAGIEFEKDRRTQKSMLRVVGQIEIRVGLMDAYCRLKSEELLKGISQVEETGTKKGIFPKKQQSYPKYLLLLGMKHNWESWYEGYVPGLLSIQNTFSVYQAARKADAMLLLPRRHSACRRHQKTRHNAISSCNNSSLQTTKHIKSSNVKQFRKKDLTCVHPKQ